jgi:hypothetical protein
LSSGIITEPPSESEAHSDSSCASDSQSTKKENDGVKVKACFTKLSLHRTTCPATENVACMTVPSGPGPPAP